MRDFQRFKRQFEAKNPERAKALRHEIMPEHEKKALSLVTEFKRLEQIVEKGGRTSYMAQDHLEKLADKMSRQKRRDAIYARTYMRRWKNKSTNWQKSFSVNVI